MSLLPFETISLRITQSGGAEAGVGVETLAGVLTGLQRSVWALAAEAQPEGFKPGARFKRRYELRCLTTLASESLPLALGPRQLELDLDTGLPPQAVFERLWSLWQALAARDEATVLALMPDQACRRRVFAELARALPGAREAWRVALVRQGREVALDAAHGALAAGWGCEAGPRGAALMTILAELTRVDFTAGTFQIRYAPNGRAMTGKYPPEAEVWLLKHRRRLIQVTGEFSLDAQDHAHALKQLVKLAPIDLSPITCTHVAADGRAWELAPPLVVTPVVDAEGQRFEAGDESLGLVARASTREELTVALRRRLEGLWAEVRRGDRPDVARAWQRRLKELQGALSADGG